MKSGFMIQTLEELAALNLFLLRDCPHGTFEKNLSKYFDIRVFFWARIKYLSKIKNFLY